MRFISLWSSMGCGASKAATSGLGVIEVRPRIQIHSDEVYEYDIEDSAEVGVAQSGKVQSKHVVVSEVSSASEVEEYIQYLRGFYDISSTQLVHSKWPPVRPIQFLDLALVEIVDKDVKEQDRYESPPPDARTHARKRRAIRLDQVGKMENGHYHRCVIVEGPPGIGKSTLAWLIGKRWCDRSMFDDLGILVHLKLRDRSVREASQLSELFRHPDPHVTAAVVATVAAVGGKGSVLMLDGFDEQAVDLQGKSLIAKVIRGNELPGVTLIITARPSSSQTLFRFRQGCGFQDQLIEVLGFRKREVDTYIDRLLRANGTLLDSFRRYIGCHPHTYSLMSVPMYCAMLVEMYTNHSGVGKPIPRTITDLYVAFTQVLLVLHEKDEAEQVDTQLSAELKTLQMHRDELVDTIRDSVSLSQSLCSDGILTQPVFGDKDQISTKEKNSLILNAVEARAINVPQVYHVFIGILKKDQSLNTCTAKMATTFKQLLEGSLPSSPSKWTCFEGLASSTLSRLAGIAKLAYDSTMKSETILHDLPERAQTLGLLQKRTDPLTGCLVHSFLHSTLQEFFTAYHVMSLTIPQQRDCIKKFASNSNNSLAMRLASGLTKYLPSSDTDDNFSSVITPKQKENASLVENLHWLFETQRPVYIRSVVGNSEQRFHCKGVSLTPFDLCALGYCITHSTALWSIQLQQCNITDEHIRMMVLAEKGKAFHHITCFRAVSCDLTPSGIVLLEPVLKNNTCLATLDLECNSIESEGAAAIAKALAHNTSLLELALSQCDLDDEAIHCLNIGLSCCKLQKLDLSRNPFTKQGALELSSVLKVHPTLKEMNVLLCDGIEDDGAAALIDALRSNNTLRMLRLDENYKHLVQHSLINRVKWT